MNIQNQLKNKIENFYLWKPSRIYWFFLLITLFIWILLGPLWWRHVDDFGPLESYIRNDYPFQSWKLFFKYQLTTGWGTYPPSWTIWQLVTYPFLFFGVSASRYFLIFEGFLSSFITSYLIICLSLNFLSYRYKLHNSNINNIKYIIEILSITFSFLNPEVMLHASSYMPYNLSAITTIGLILILIPLKKENILFKQKTSYFVFKISYIYFLLFVYLSLFLGFQSPILFLAFLVTLISKKYIYAYDILKNLRFILKTLKPNINNFLNSNNKKVLLPIFLIILFFTFTYLYKLLILFGANTKPGNFLDGNWASGFKNIYDLNLYENDFKEFFLKSLNNTSAIISLSLYPFRSFQFEFGIFLSIVYIFSLLNIIKFKQIGNIYFINNFAVLIIIILLSGFDKFIYSPTRHTIFLYPYFWFPIIISFTDLILSIKSFNNRNLYYSFIYLPLSLYLFFSIGLIDSHKKIQYSFVDRNKLIELARQSDYQINYKYSFFPSHGSSEYKSSNLKSCDKNQKKPSLKFFIFSHRKISMDNSIKNDLREILLKNARNCFNEKDDFNIIDKIEKYGKFDLEQNNKIFNGGSGIYAYLIETKK